MNIALCNLGCSKNQVDGEKMLGRLVAAGHRLVQDPARAELILVNTCAFITAAKQEAIDTILEMTAWKRTGRCRLLVVCGCFSQRYAREAGRQLPEVDHWVSLHNWREELDAIAGAPAGRGDPPRRLIGTPATQYLKIAEGCSRRCSFCAIPSIRGPLHSRPLADILAEAAWLEQRGTRECILVSQDTSAWGRDRGTRLVRLLETLLARTRFRWLRLMYLHPSQVDDDLLRLMACEPRLCPYLDIPLQHIADPVLRSMRRAPLSAGIRRLIERIRRTAPDAAIRTSLIVGYPGETEAHFRELQEFLSWARLDRVGVFPFSPEEGTAAYRMRPRPAAATVRRRLEQIMSLQARISRDLGEARVGRTEEVIIDGPADEEGFRWTGRTRRDAPEVDGCVLVRGGERLRPGAFVKVRFTAASDHDLEGYVVGARGHQQKH
jgi:ribosomal protein S12 methylthiotransferase